MRDPTEMRARYKAKITAPNRWNDAFERVIAGDFAAREELSRATRDVEETTREFHEESRHFAMWVQR